MSRDSNSFNKTIKNREDRYRTETGDRRRMTEDRDRDRTEIETLIETETETETETEIARIGD